MLTKISEFPDHPQNWITCSFCHSQHLFPKNFGKILFELSWSHTDKQTLAKT